jgi:hypothetical protein
MLTRHALAATVISALLHLNAIPVASAATTMTLTLQPHCAEQDRSKCTDFATADAKSLQTQKLNAGDILDVDIVVRGSGFADVRSVRAWLSYDPIVLEARSVELTSALPSPTPGEQTVDQIAKVVKIGGSTSTGLAADNTPVARVTFRVLATTENTSISFYDYNSSGLGHTAVNGEKIQAKDDQGALPSAPCIDFVIGCGGTTNPLLASEPTSLTVVLSHQAADAAEAAAVPQSMIDQENAQGSGIQPSTIPYPTATTSSAGAPMAPQGSAFTLLQVQDVRLTSRENVIYMGWQSLRSTELAGYNVYYGTVTGKYIQRKSLAPNATSIVLRDLEPGVTYYLAVRAVNTQGQESVFSQEVSVTVGQPETATVPLLNGSITPTPTNTIKKNGGSQIQGETGLGSSLLWIVLGSAGIGTFFAFRRQISLS